MVETLNKDVGLFSFACLQNVSVSILLQTGKSIMQFLHLHTSYVSTKSKTCIIFAIVLHTKFFLCWTACVSKKALHTYLDLKGINRCLVLLYFYCDILLQCKVLLLSFHGVWGFRVGFAVR